MKKFLALVMAMMMILAMGTVAFAETQHNSVAGGTYALPITKTYNGGTVKVNETITFRISLKSVINEYEEEVSDSTGYVSGDTSIDSLTLIDGNWKQDSGKWVAEGNVQVTLPTFNKAGIYTFTVEEESSTGSGVTVGNNTVTLKIYVGYDNGGALKILNSNYVVKNAKGEKESAFNNSLTTGSFSVKKEVTGNMASATEQFDIDVILTSDSPVGNAVIAPDESTMTWEKGNDNKYTAMTTLSISQDSGKQTFSDIPVGVTVTVKETSGQKGYTTKSIVCDKTTITERKDNAMSLNMTQGESTLEFVVTNNKDATIETGISMDNAPYMMIMALVVLAGAAMLLKKRAYND